MPYSIGTKCYGIKNTDQVRESDEWENLHVRRRLYYGLKGKQRKNIQSRSNSLNRKTKREKVKGMLGEHGGTVEFYCNVWWC